MKRFVLLGAVLGLLCFCGGAVADPQVLSDDELAQVTGGFDLCSSFGIAGSCAVSLGQTFDGSSSNQVLTAEPLNQNFSSNTTSGGINQIVIINSGGGSYQINTFSQ